MLRIILCCAGGISTSFLQQNIQKAISTRGIDGEVIARSEREINSYIADIDVVLLAPQARYAENNIRKVCSESQKGFALIDSTIYGHMDGNAALDLALDAFAKKGGNADR